MKNKKKSKVTIKDVADHVGVHHSTVSRALSRDKQAKISPSVVRKIERAAEKLGYTPNLVASSLKQNRSFAIGVIVPDLTNPLFPPIIRGIQNYVESRGYTVITANTDDDPDREQQALRMMRARSMEGVIIAAAKTEDPFVDEFINLGIPIVLVNRKVDRPDVNAVVPDDDFAAREVLDHLIGLGHRKIAHIAGPLETSTGHDRARTFQDYVRIQDLDPGLVVVANKFTVDEGTRATEELLEMDDGFTAVFAASDLLALGCIDGLSAAGRTVPGDVSVVGSNNIPFLSRMSPALSSVDIPKYEMGDQAAKLLMELISGERSEPVIMRMQPRLIVRDSTAEAS